MSRPPGSPAAARARAVIELAETLRRLRVPLHVRPGSPALTEALTVAGVAVDVELLAAAVVHRRRVRCRGCAGLGRHHEPADADRARFRDC